MPFLVAIQSPNWSIQRRSAAAGGSSSSRSRAPVVSRVRRAAELQAGRHVPGKVVIDL
ncbi:hypothetical protein [Actinocatenispora sera]|uniref:hypothetical protein n=1 Tax=Actinocatenispora sera TaxID=390989 RepID=UPI001B80B766|nr:hypothetical protein [Actinocatenispora sera]